MNTNTITAIANEDHANTVSTRSVLGVLFLKTGMKEMSVMREKIAPVMFHFQHWFIEFPVVEKHALNWQKI
jgi:hypothetical protein